MKAVDLMRLLLEHVGDKRLNAVVVMEGDKQITNCWWDDEKKCIVLSSSAN
jgi:hypothetical protein